MFARDEYYTVNDDEGAGLIYGSGEGTGVWMGQVFTPVHTMSLRRVEAKLYRLGTVGDITLSVYATTGSPALPTGASLSDIVVDGDTITTDSAGEWVPFTLGSALSLTGGTAYALILKVPDGYNNGGSAGMYWRRDGTSSVYANGHHVQLYSAVGSWQYSSTTDLMFETWGTSNIIGSSINLGSLF